VNIGTNDILSAELTTSKEIINENIIGTKYNTKTKNLSVYIFSLDIDKADKETMERMTARIKLTIDKRVTP